MDPRAQSAASPREDERAPDGRAWGKVILLGEHAVVYGVPALAVGIERGAHAWVDARTGEGPCHLRVDGWEVSVSEDDDQHDLGRSLRALLHAHRSLGGHPAAGIAVRARSDLPPGGGLGCSAALGVAIARAVAPSSTDDRIQELAMAWERVFHGSPSGIDAAVSSRGGCVLFEKGHALEPVKPKSGLLLCVGLSGVVSSTRTMVEAVARLRARRPEVVAKAFAGVQSLVRNARLAIEAGDRVGLGRLMNLNQMILSGLFVSTEEIERMCDLARAAGALGAKLTGAGGGGSVVALVPNASIAESVLAAWTTEGYWGFSARVAASEPQMAAATETSP